ncbi:thioredoxin family protein [Noviherbaspirillum sp. CPCC 100848]|uniref:Thioredoxin family protein n=1 Tax=Noviherbaspirillum album TaxID=3080276 RepID=A0ABU6J447_9BURK|nr:thioredoxin family protein [Noviherbaspirillum sp. CPCC 100848]MEC4718411.1 thioredoxin family protein [Noviherbaspirillum sp. CPCC 100848]
MTEHVRAELVAHAPEGIAAGQPVWFGLRIRHQPHWHTYWKNPGDSGLATSLTWTLPAGFVAGEIAWPTPKQLPFGPLMNYGYEGDLLLAVPVTVPDGFTGASLPVSLRADWLVCKDVCIPEYGEFKLELPTQPMTAHAALFAQAHANQPRTVSTLRAEAHVDADKLVVAMQGVPSSLQGKPVQLFVETAGVVESAAAPIVEWNGDRLAMRLPLSAQRSESPASMHAVLTAGHQSSGILVSFDVKGPWPQPGSEASPAADSLPDSTPATPWLLSLVFAFLGGAILNLMPCVFPVLSLKVLGFAQHAGDRRKVVAGGLAYTAGVVTSFLLLAGLLLALRGSGEQLGWGFQLQSPMFVAALAVLFSLIGLNLAGLFEFGSVLPSGIASARARNPVADDFLSGVLTVLIASPCTAPFMGVALGAALTQPTPQAMAVFGVLGLGMAAPYLTASLFPRLARLLPRPGAWMARFKTFMAFPMFATVVWLIWVLGQQIGINGVAAILALLVAVAFAAWMSGIPMRTNWNKLASMGTTGALVVAVSVWAWPSLQSEPLTDVSGKEATTSAWHAWSTEAVERARQEGRPVFVDFTAAWCVTCQYNKRTTLSDEALLKEFAAKNVLLLRADWTRRDERITQELTRLGRSGVPVYAFYAPSSNKPKLLSELLSVAEVRQTLEVLSKSIPQTNTL